MSYLKDDQANGSDSNFQQGPKDHSPTPNGETELQLEMPISEAMEEFELMTKVSGNAESTIHSYKYTYNRLTQEIDKDTSIGEISTKDIRLFLSELLDEDLSKNTVAIHYRNLNVLFNWLVDEHYDICRRYLSFNISRSHKIISSESVVKLDNLTDIVLK